MTAVWFPDELDKAEAEHDAAIAEDRGHALDYPIWETDADLPELYLALADALRRRDAAEALAEMQDGANYDKEFNAADHAAFEIKKQIDELEDHNARADEQSARAWHQWSSL